MKLSTAAVLSSCLPSRTVLCSAFQVYVGNGASVKPLSPFPTRPPPPILPRGGTKKNTKSMTFSENHFPPRHRTFHSRLTSTYVEARHSKSFSVGSSLSGLFAWMSSILPSASFRGGGGGGNSIPSSIIASKNVPFRKKTFSFPSSRWKEILRRRVTSKHFIFSVILAAIIVFGPAFSPARAAESIIAEGISSNGCWNSIASSAASASTIAKNSAIPSPPLS